MEKGTPSGKVSLISKIAYGFGDGGNNFSWMFVGNFLMFFYTDVFGISMAAVATLMLVSRAWDAINDPIIGALSDKTRTRWGRFRPWILFGAPTTAVLLVLTFWAHPTWSETSKIIYMYVTYCTLVLAYTCVNLPYGTMCSSLTQDINERAQINTSRSVCAMVCIGIINIITMPLMEALGQGNPRQGFLLVAVVYGAIFTAMQLFCFAKTKEVVEVPKQPKLPLSTQFRTILANRPYLLALVGQFLFGLILYGRNADLIYYFKYCEGDANLFSFYSLVIIVPSIIGAALFQPVFNWLGNKGWTAAFFSLWTGVTMFMLYFFSPVTSPVPFYIFSALAWFFFSGFNTAIYAIIPDCVEYGQWRTGIRNEGFQYAFVSLGNKGGMAVGTALVAWALGSAGYIADVEQNPEVLSVMRHIFSTIPGVLWVVTAIVLYFYKLDRRQYNHVLDEINSGRTYESTKKD